MNDDKSVFYGNSKVLYRDHLDGGGREFGQEFIPYVRALFPRGVDSIFEFCAGPGFIGFSLLASGLCRKLFLGDINEEAVELARRTVAANDLSRRVEVYCSDVFDDIPSDLRWDLIVSNPPHSGNSNDIPKWGPDLIYKDPNWEIHRRFYNGVGSRLRDGGQAILQENFKCSTLYTFDDMITAAGLRIIARDICSGDPRKFFLRTGISEG